MGISHNAPLISNDFAHIQPVKPALFAVQSWGKSRALLEKAHKAYVVLVAAERRYLFHGEGRGAQVVLRGLGAGGENILVAANAELRAVKLLEVWHAEIQPLRHLPHPAKLARAAVKLGTQSAQLGVVRAHICRKLRLSRALAELYHQQFYQ